MAFEEGIQIEELEATALPNLLHRIPAQRSGITVYLTVQQIVDFALVAIRDGVASNTDTLSKIADAIGNDPNFSATIYDAIDGNLVPPGLIAPYGNTTPPVGWIKANGASLNRVTYSDLFAIYGTTFGSLSGSTFSVPDLRGEFIRGWDDGRGIDSSRVFGSFQEDAFESHYHDLVANTAPRATGSSSCVTNLSGGASTGSTSSVGGTETRPRNVALQYIIKY